MDIIKSNIENVEKFSITINSVGKIHFETLSQFIKTSGKLLKRTTKSISNNTTYNDFYIEKIREGSIILDIISITGSNPQLINETISVASMFRDLIYIKLHIGDGSNTTITSKGEDVKIVKNGHSFSTKREVLSLYTQSKETDKELSKSFEMLSINDSTVSIKIDLLGDANENLLISSEEMKEASQPADLAFILGDEKEKTYRNVKVGVEKIDFSGSTKWNVIINKRKESVTIEDIDFLERIKNENLVFGPSTVMTVDYTIQYFNDNDDKYNNIKKPKINILRIHKIENDSYDQTTLYVD